MKLYVFFYDGKNPSQTEYIQANDLELAKVIFKQIMKKKSIVYFHIIRITEYQKVAIRTWNGL